MHGVQILTQFPVFAFDYLVHTLFPEYLLNQFCAVVTVSDWFWRPKSNPGWLNWFRSFTLHLNVCIMQMFLAKATTLEVYNMFFNSCTSWELVVALLKLEISL